MEAQQNMAPSKRWLLPPNRLALVELLAVASAARQSSQCLRVSRCTPPTKTWEIKIKEELLVQGKPSHKTHGREPALLLHKLVLATLDLLLLGSSWNIQNQPAMGHHAKLSIQAIQIVITLISARSMLLSNWIKETIASQQSNQADLNQVI